MTNFRYDDPSRTVIIDEGSDPGAWREAMQFAQNQQIGGNHYISKSIQPWDAMEAWMPRAEFVGFLRGNAIKYLSRAGSKGDALEDYKKAQHYLTKLIEMLERPSA